VVKVIFRLAIFASEMKKMKELSFFGQNLGVFCKLPLKTGF